jgi:citrate lyase subunit alpha/citrate CoA-transferase
MRQSLNPFAEKIVYTIGEAIERVGLKDGMTVSFHHHLREGDSVMRQVLEEVKIKGIRDLTLCASSLMNCHDFLVDFIRDGTISQLDSSGLRGKLGRFIRQGGMKNPVVLRSHGGRARAIHDGERHIDVAFVAASCADIYGNANGVQGRNAFGSLGYGMWDSRQAKKTVIITDTLSQSVLPGFGVSQSDSDIVAVVESIGDKNRLKIGALEEKADPISKVIAKNVGRFLIYSGVLRNGASIQMGSGGVSLQVIRYLQTYFSERKWRFRFAVGGITGSLITALEEGLVETLMDVQSFNPTAARSLLDNKNHREIDANTYANPDNPYCIVNDLDIAILSALEIDRSWNVNVLTGSDGSFMGALGGHPDVGESAKTTIIVAPLIRERIPILVDQVNTIVTPGSSIDAFVTDWGIAVREEREDIRQCLRDNGVSIYSLQQLYEKAERLVGVPQKPSETDRVVAVVQDRKGNALHLIKSEKEKKGVGAF